MSGHTLTLFGRNGSGSFFQCGTVKTGVSGSVQFLFF